MLLNRPDPTDTTTTTTDTTMTTDQDDTTTTTVDNTTPSHHNHHHQQQLHVHQALFAAARNGYTDCVRLLLNSGVSTDVLDENGLTPLHFASTHGHCGCVEVLLAAGATVDHRGAPSGHQTALFMASEAGSLDCVRALLNGGADRSHTTADGCTPLHAAVRSGHVDTLRLLLCHPVPGEPSAAMTSDPAAHPVLPLALPAALLNQANAEGWTAAHMAAARGFKECLEVLFSHSDQDIDRRDKCNRTIHDVATDDCKDLLENLDSYRVQVCVQLSSTEEGGGGEGGEGGVVVEPMCLLQEEEEEEEEGGAGRRGGRRRWAVLGRVCVERSTRWAALGHALGHAFTSHLQLLCCRDDSPPSSSSSSAPPTLAGPRDDSGPPTHPSSSSLGLGPASIASVLIGDTAWLPGQELPLSPWDLVRKPLSQRIMLRLKGLSESCLDELAVDSLFPLPLLHNYVRLVEQYGNVIFHGLEGSCQEHIANQIARCIKAKQEAGGVCCDVVRVEVDESLTKEQLLETFITCGFLVPAVGLGSGVRGHCVVVLLEGLEKASSLPGLLGDLCHSLDNRGSACPLALPAGPHHFREGGFLIGTLSKTRLQGSELRLQQHFRWVTLRWDQEPLHGMLGRHLRRKLLHKTGTGVWRWEGALERSVLWVSRVWQQLNACLSRLGTHEALLGPRLFLSCPVVPHNTQAVVKWLVRLWNAVVVPRVEEAIVSRVTAKRSSPSSSSSSPSPSSRRASSGSHGLTSGQQAVVKAALSILVNKAVLLGCPLPRHEIDRHLLEFQGGSFPMSAIGSCKGSSTAGRKGRDSGQWRRANTSPRKKGSPASNWSCGGPLREGSLSTTDVRFTNGNSQRLAVGEPAGLSVFSDDETDLIRELTSMCSSKSEPDISKMAQSKDDLDVVYSSPSRGPADPHRPDQEGSPQPRTQTPSSSSSRPSSRGPASSPSPASERRGQAPSGRPAKSQLPVPSSRGQQQPRASSSSSTSGVSGSSTSSQTTLSNRTASRTESSSKTKPVPSGSNLHLHQQHHRNNNIVNGNSQPHHEDIWVLHRDLHQNSINNNK